MARKPQIILSSLDIDRIEALLAAIPASVFPGKADLQAELDRADVLPPEEIPPHVVTMNSTVKFSIEETGKEFCLTLVYPAIWTAALIGSRSLPQWAVRCWGCPSATNSLGLGQAANQ